MDESTTRKSYIDQYGQEYYSSYGKNGTHYLSDPSIRLTTHGLASFLLSTIKFKRHLDVGCAFGLLVDIMRRKRVQSFGLDVSEYAIENALPASKRFVWEQDITSRPITEKYELVTCVEVIEHVPPELEGIFLDGITKAASWIYFSSEYNLDEPTHINCQHLSYWIDQFERRGFIPMREKYAQIPWGRLFRKATTASDTYSILDKETRLDVHTRDLFSCVMCGKKGVQIHEIVPRSFFGRDTMWQCFLPKNRISLCPECHAIAHTKEERKKAIAVMSAKYGYTYEEDFYQQYQEN